MSDNARDLPRVTVAPVQGRPLLHYNGVPFFYAAYWLRHLREPEVLNNPNLEADRAQYRHDLADLIRPFAEAGLHCYEVVSNIGWNGPGDWDPANPSYRRNYGPATEQFSAITEVDPQARMMVNFLLHPPEAWEEAYPEEFELDDRGNRYEVSLGSDRYLDDLLAGLPKFIRYCEESGYAEHFLSYFFSFGHEGFTYSTLQNALSDYSPAMERCFRQWLRERYNADQSALREAWQEPHVTFDAAPLPNRAEQLATDLCWFRDPTKNRKLFDYIECRVDRFVEMHWAVSRCLKEACDRRLPVYCFGAYLQVTGWPGSYWFDDKGLAAEELSPHATSIQTGWRRILECPDLDGWESPYDYLYRQIGGVCLNQSVEESMRLRGKAFQINEDTRTFLAGEAGDVYGTVFTRPDTTAVYRRNFGAIASHWGGCNWMEQIHNWLHDDEIIATLAGLNRLLQKSVEWPETPVDPIGVFLDEESIRYEKPLIDLDWDLIYKQRVFGLSHCGVPFRFHLLDDLALDNMPEYRCNLLLNVFHMNDEKQSLLHERLQRGGKTLLWMIAPGFCHAEEGLSLESMRRLTGLSFAKYDVPWEQWVTVTDFTHPITSGLPTDYMYGSNARIGPCFYVDDPDARVLGRRLLFQGRHEAALVHKEAPGYHTVYSAVPLLPAELLRNLARFAGCHVYTEHNDVVTAGRGLLTYHTAGVGERLVRLPEPTPVWDLFTGEQLAESAAEVRLHFDQPGTIVLTTLPEELWRE